MAEDDVLRMRAVLLDQASGALSQLRRNLGAVGKDVDTSKAKREFVELGRTIGSATGTLTGTGGLLQAFGQFRGAGGGIVVGLAAVGAGFYGMARQLSEFANKTADLKFASRDMGVSIAQLKAFQRVARDVRIDPSEATQALQTFARNAEDFRLRIGSVREELYKLGAGDVVEAIRRAQTPMDGLRIAFERMQELQRRDPATARRFAETMFGAAAAARMNWQEIQRLNTQYEASGKYTADAIERSEAFRKKWEELDNTLTKLKERTLTPLFPTFTAGLEAINTAIDKTKAGVEWLSEHMPSWGGGGRAPNLSARGGANQTQRGNELRGSAKSFWDWFSNPGSTRLGTRHGGAEKEAEELKKQSGDLAENFKKMNFELARPGGGVGGGIINAAYTGGGGFRGFGGGGAAPGGGGVVPRSFSNPQGGTNDSAANPLTGPQTDAIGGRRPMESGGGSAGITAPAGTPTQRSGMATVTTAGGRKFRVDARFAPNFQGFIKDYEAAGGVIGPESGTLGHRPHNRSGHPIGAAIDINQIGYGVRGRGGRTLPVEEENRLAAKWGLVSGANWRRPDTGHFGIRSPEAAREALVRQGLAPASPPTADTTGKTVRGSYFGGTPGWPNDPSEPASRPTAGGFKNTMPGIALPRSYGKPTGQMYEVTGPDGRKMYLPHIDTGPHRRTGRGIDITAAGAAAMGYTPKTFPTDGQFGYRRVDQALAAQTGGAVKAEGTVNVEVHAGAGTRVNADSSGLFQNTRVHRYRQMDETGLDGGAQ